MDALRPEINWNGYLYSSIETDISTMYCVSLWIIMCWCMVLEFGAKSYVIGFMIYIFSIEKAKTMIIKKKWSFNLYFKHKTIQQNERNIIHDYDVVCNK